MIRLLSIVALTAGLLAACLGCDNPHVPEDPTPGVEAELEVANEEIAEEAEEADLATDVVVDPEADEVDLDRQEQAPGEAAE